MFVGACMIMWIFTHKPGRKTETCWISLYMDATAAMTWRVFHTFLSPCTIYLSSVSTLIGYVMKKAFSGHMSLLMQVSTTYFHLYVLLIFCSIVLSHVFGNSTRNPVVEWILVLVIIIKAFSFRSIPQLWAMPQNFRKSFKSWSGAPMKMILADVPESPLTAKISKKYIGQNYANVGIWLREKLRYMNILELNNKGCSLPWRF